MLHKLHQQTELSGRLYSQSTRNTVILRAFALKIILDRIVYYNCTFLIKGIKDFIILLGNLNLDHLL